MRYRCEATSIAGFIQQFAVAYVGHGYRFYAVRRIPPNKDPRHTDARIIDYYGLELSKWQRSRRKRQGKANCQYLRHGHFSVLIATPPVGGHSFFAECPDYKDIQRHALRYAGYSVGYPHSTRTGRRHASVRIDREQYLRLRDYLLEVATHRRREALEAEFNSLRFEPFARVARQYLTLLRLVNEKRGAAGYELLSHRCLRLHRKSIPVFEEHERFRRAA